MENNDAPTEDSWIPPAEETVESPTRMGRLFVEGGVMSRNFADEGTAKVDAAVMAVEAVVWMRVPTAEVLVRVMETASVPPSGSPETVVRTETEAVAPI